MLYAAVKWLILVNVVETSLQGDLNYEKERFYPGAETHSANNPHLIFSETGIFPNIQLSKLEQCFHLTSCGHPEYSKVKNHIDGDHGKRLWSIWRAEYGAQEGKGSISNYPLSSEALLEWQRC